jgi:flagellar motor switch protein FliN/FliY
MKLNDGSVVELERLAGEHLDILVNGTLLARGEVVLVGERLGIRFTEIISPEKRARSL